MPSTTTKKAIASQHQTASDAVETKTDKVIKLLRRKNGATIADLQKATGWQPHSVRGFLSGTLRRRLGLNVESERREGKDRRYRIAPSCK